jgi:hypothetical protein
MGAGRRNSSGAVRLAHLGTGQFGEGGQMKKLFVVALAGWVLLAPVTADARIGDSAKGRGTDVSLGKFTFTAEGFGTGTQATGSWKHTFSQAQGHGAISGQVTCLVVVGNTAGIGGFVTNSDLPTIPPGSQFFVQAQDVADPGDGADRYAFNTFPVASPCGVLPGVGTPIVNGNIDVVASTFPP